MPLSPGTRLGTYEILGPLGSGGMGEVHRARDHRLGREVAIKVLPSDVAASPDRLERLEQEARAVAALNHPNIVVLYSVEDEDGIRFLTMELVEGQTLSNLVTPGGLPLPRILELAIPLTNALVAAHVRGVIHRDLKPDNVMVTREGRVKVLDFGLAKMTGADSPGHGSSFTVTAGGSLTAEGQVFGTVPYMAPERLRGEAVDARSDLFSLGVILYELATGRKPFAGETSMDVGHAILRDMPEPLNRLRADLPGEFGGTVSHCLEKNPRERVQTALDVGNELRRLREVVERREPARPASSRVVSIAVLPFVNRSASADDEYFSDGLADELLNMLAKIRGLKVAARASSFQFKGKNEDLSVIGRKLNVATLLDGSVRKAGKHVRISVQLVKVSDGYHLWSESYDRTLDDIFALQDDIARSVVKELRATLLGEEADSKASGEVKAEVAKAARGRGTDPEAHRLYLQARYLIDRGNREDTAKGIGYLKDALELDPSNALAWAELSLAYSKEADFGWVAVAEGHARALEAVERALSLEPDLAEGHARRGWMQMTYDFNWRGAEMSYRRALELAPENASVLRGVGVLAWTLGRHEEAIGYYRRALVQDPLSGATYLNLGTALLRAGRPTEAEEAYRKASEFTQHMVGVFAALSLVLLAQDRDEEALVEAMREPDEAIRLYAVSIIHHAWGREAASDEALEELVREHAEDSAYQIAEVYAARAEVDPAFKWLERAYMQRDGGLMEMKASPQLSSLHGDPRWSRFMNKMGLED